MNQSKLFVTLGIAAVSASSQACSVCIAHAIGAGLRALGAQSLHHGKTIIGFSYLNFAKSNVGDVAGTTEKHSQNEYTLEALHGLSDSWMVHVTAPYVMKSLLATGAAPVRTQGLGDITVGANYQLPTSFKNVPVFALSGDVKLPTGPNSLKDSTGTLLDAHSQIGTGSTDFAVGLLATQHLGSDLAFGSLRYRINGANSSGYRYGQVGFYSFGVSHDLNPVSSLVLEINGRVAAKDRTDQGTNDDDSGGHFAYLSASYRRNLAADTGLIASVQVPVIRHLNGTQSEGNLVSIGIFRRL